MGMSKLVQTILRGLEIEGKTFIFNNDTWEVKEFFESESKCCKAVNSIGLTQLFDCNFVKECILNMKFCKRMKNITILFEGKEVTILGYSQRNSRLAVLKDFSTGKEFTAFIHGGDNNE